jgi:hypothetical protein
MLWLLAVRAAREELDAVRLTVVAPEKAREAIEMLFADFVAASDPDAAATV